MMHNICKIYILVAGYLSGMEIVAKMQAPRRGQLIDFDGCHVSVRIYSRRKSGGWIHGRTCILEKVIGVSEGLSVASGICPRDSLSRRIVSESRCEIRSSGNPALDLSGIAAYSIRRAKASIIMVSHTSDARKRP